MAKPFALTSIRLVNYKGFEDYRVDLRSTNVLVGANNAGKSTVLGALRLIAAMVPTARRIKPNAGGQVNGRGVRGWTITGAAIEASAFSHENVRHDFRLQETRIEVTINSGVRLVASWESMEDYDEDEHAPPGMFFVFPPDGGPIMNPRDAARTLVPDIAMVPTLTPLNDRESYISDETLRRHRTSRRSSRYFRNALYRLETGEWDAYTAFVYERTPEISSLTLTRAMGTIEDDFDLFYEEQGTRREREIGWAGDGIQIWLQVLYHLWRQKEAPAVVLDEPDVFLHPDLQRRLARAIFASPQQTILATHSIEILAEAEPGSAVWIDRSRVRSERPQADGSLALVGRRLGSGYELGVGRALRSRTTVFLPGDDAPILAHLARRLGATSVASADGYATVPLTSVDVGLAVSAFRETMKSLGASVQTFVIFGGEIINGPGAKRERLSMIDAGAEVHVWARRSLESYLLEANAIASVSGIGPADARVLLDVALSAQHDQALFDLQVQRLAERRAEDGSVGSIREAKSLADAELEFEEIWSRVDERVILVDAPQVLVALNAALTSRGATPVNTHSLAKRIRPDDISREVREVVERLADLLS